MKVTIDKVVIHTNPMEWTIYLQIQTIMEDLFKGTLTREQAEIKLAFLLQLCGYINQEVGKGLV